MPLGEIEEISPSFVVVPIQCTDVRENHVTIAVQYKCSWDAWDLKALWWFSTAKIDRHSKVILL